jgi:hypothetical protein
MGIRSVLSKPFAAYVDYTSKEWKKHPERYQEKTMQSIIHRAADTAFGKDHGFKSIRNYQDFKKQVPVGDYEQLRPYIDRILSGEADVLWPARPVYFAKTSGTTSGAKYIPVTKASVPNHMNSARNALLSYVHETGKSRFLDGKLIFLSGSPEVEKHNGILIGRLSGIVNHHIPGYLRTNQLPSYQTNCMEDWEAKVDQIVEETIHENMTLISGIPPWVQMYFDKLVERSGGKPVKDIFPNFEMFVYGGVNFEPYRVKLIETIGKNVDSIETYPASEGFIAYQDSQHEPGLLLLLNEGIFYEFMRADQYHDEQPERISIADVEIGVNYALVLNSNAGLWGYSIGDTIKFISKNPYRIIVTGRIKHFISAFGEHVIGEEIEKAMKYTVDQFPETELIEFTVAPNVTPSHGLPLHEWYIEFGREPKDLDAFAKALNLHLQKLNSYYDDLITGHVLRRLDIIKLKRHAFKTYMKSKGKLGGQNKVPRLSNDRNIAEAMWELDLIASTSSLS